MTSSRSNADFVVVGAGIVGLSLARELNTRCPAARILVLEKESRLGVHASGRNSGVLHSGIYYPEGSLKGRLCDEGAREIAEYCRENGLPIIRCGKVIVPLSKDDDTQIDILASRARVNGARVEIVDEHQLKSLEPAAHSSSGRALYAADTSVVEPRLVLEHVAGVLRKKGIQIRFGLRLLPAARRNGSLQIDGDTIHYGLLFNAAGLHADRISHLFDAGLNYSILPFKGIYYRLRENVGYKMNGLIYPAPDLRVPFLGVHFTKTVSGAVYLGPTAVPAFGREHYHGIRGITPRDAARITAHLLRQYVTNQQGFRRLVHQEGSRFFRVRFAAAARALVPALRASDLQPSSKVGIRAQLLNTRTGKLEMDFVVERGERSVHVLNAVSPAFTSAFSFARYVLDNFLEGSIQFHTA